MCINLIQMKKIFFIILFSILSCFVLGQGTSTTKFKKVKTDTITGRSDALLWVKDTIIFRSTTDSLWAIRISGDTLFLNNDTLYTTTAPGGASKWGTDGTDIYNLNANNVRIGSLPSDTLDTLNVVGRIRSWSLRNTSFKLVTADTSGTLQLYELPRPLYNIVGGTGNADQTAVWINDSTLSYGLIYDNRVDSLNIDGQFFLRQDNDFGISTKLGIGMTDPQYTLDVTGTGNFTSYVTLLDSLRVEEQTLLKKILSIIINKGSTNLLYVSNDADATKDSTVLINSTGGLLFPNTGVISTTTGNIELGSGEDTVNIKTTLAAPIVFFTTDLKRMEITPAGHLKPNTTSVYMLGTASTTWRSAHADSLVGTDITGTDLYLADDIVVAGLENDGSPDSVVTVAAGKLYRSFVPGGGIAGKDSLFWSKGTTVGLFPKSGEDVYITSSTTLKPDVTIRNSNADATAGFLNFIKASSSPADDDKLGTIYFKGDDSGGTETLFGMITGYSTTVANGDEAGRIIFNIMHDDSSPSQDAFLDMNADNGTPGQGYIYFNDGGKDIDFRVEGVGEDYGLFVQGSNGYVGIGAAPTRSQFDVAAVGSFNGLYSSVAASDASPDSVLTWNTGTVRSTFVSGGIAEKDSLFWSRSSTLNLVFPTTSGDDIWLGTGDKYFTDDARGSYVYSTVATDMLFIVNSAKMLELQQNENSIIIGGGVAGIDYIIKVDGETNDGFITYMEDEDRWDFTEDIQLASATTTKPVISLVNTTLDANASLLSFYKRGNGADEDIIGTINAYGYDDGAADTEFARIDFSSEETANNDEGGRMNIQLMFDDGTPALESFLDMSADNGSPDEGYFEINSGQKDIDVIINSESTADAFILQGSDGNIVIANSFIHTPDNTGDVVAGTGITLAMLSGDMRYNGSGAIDITANPQFVAGADGQVIKIIGLSDANTLTLDDGTGLQLAGAAQMVLGRGDVISFTYVTSLSVWVENYRSDN